MQESVTLHDKTSLYEFVRIGEVAETTTQLLSLNLQHNASLAGRAPAASRSGAGAVEHLVLQQARDYLAEVREGFVLSVKSSQVASRRELRFLLDRVIFDWAGLSEELGLDDDLKSLWGEPDEQNRAVDDGASSASPSAPPAPPIELSQLRSQLVAFGMAAAAFGSLPATPAEQITFPFSFSTPPTYADIPAPTTPGEMLHRIEEIETMLWQLMSSDLQQVLNRRYGALRRTYGFFEVSAQMARRESERFGVKQPQPQFRLFS